MAAWGGRVWDLDALRVELSQRQGSDLESQSLLASSTKQSSCDTTYDGASQKRDHPVNIQISGSALI